MLPRGGILHGRLKTVARKNITTRTLAKGLERLRLEGYKGGEGDCTLVKERDASFLPLFCARGFC